MKKILFLSSISPFETSSGGHQRTNLLCRSLSEIAHVDVFYCGTDSYPKEISIPNCDIVFFETSDKHDNTLSTRLKRILKWYSAESITNTNVYLSGKLAEVLSNKQYDFIVVRYLETAIQFGVKFNKNVIIDIDDLPADKMVVNNLVLKKTYFKFFLISMYIGLMSKMVRHHTKKIIASVYHSFVANPNHIISSNVSCLPNIPFSITISPTYDDSKKTFTVLFVGLLTYAPNYIGVDSFLNEVWPAVKEKVPSATFRIVGKVNPEYAERWKKYEGVKVLGYVDDLIQEYHHCDIAVAPIYSGGGTNIKILEAMNAKKACVISSFSAKGFENILEDGENILIAHNKTEFAEKIVKAMNDDNYRQRIAANAYNTVENRFSYPVFSDTVKRIFNKFA